MLIAGFRKTSFIDYPGQPCAVVFTPYCNMNCSYCHNEQILRGDVPLISEDEVMDYLEKRAGLVLSGCDAYINVVGGLQLDETAADLAIVLALASSFKDLPVGADLAAVGEIGLSGEVRSVNHLNQRLSEIARLGFRRCVIPAHVRDDVQQYKQLETIPVRSVREALRAVIG